MKSISTINLASHYRKYGMLDHQRVPQIWALSEIMSQTKKNGCLRRETLVIFVWVVIGQNFWAVITQPRMKIMCSNQYEVLHWKSAKKCFYVFIVMSYSHTCGLEVDIFVFGWDMAISIPMITHTKVMRVPFQGGHFFGCDVILDLAHWYKSGCDAFTRYRVYIMTLFHFQLLEHSANIPSNE